MVVAVVLLEGVIAVVVTGELVVNWSVIYWAVTHLLMAIHDLVVIVVVVVVVVVLVVGLVFVVVVVVVMAHFCIFMTTAR